MFADVATTPDEGLMDLFDAIARELSEHFAREEAAMTEARVPVLLPHLELHAHLLREVDKMRGTIASGDADGAPATPWNNVAAGGRGQGVVSPSLKAGSERDACGAIRFPADPIGSALESSVASFEAASRRLRTRSGVLHRGASRNPDPEERRRRLEGW
jgi:hypothetical protein